jgi:hypothetical protein
MAIFLPVFSLPEGPERDAALPEANRKAGAANCEMIKGAAAVLAVLDGPDVDSGTAAEIGYAGALGVPVIGLRTDIRLSGDNPATTVNLQVQYFLAELCADVSTAVDALRRVTTSGAASQPAVIRPAPRHRRRGHGTHPSPRRTHSRARRRCAPHRRLR